MALNPRQKQFIVEYLVDKNATQAAIRAGYSKRSAGSMGHDLLKVPEIREAIEGKNLKQLEKADAKAQSVLDELARFGFADIKDAFDSNGVLLALHKMPDDIRRAIKSFEVEELFDTPLDDGAERLKIGRVVKVSFWDKPKGLELLGKNQKLFTEKHEIEAGPTLEALILASMAKGLK